MIKSLNSEWRPIRAALPRHRLAPNNWMTNRSISTAHFPEGLHDALDGFMTFAWLACLKSAGGDAADFTPEDTEAVQACLEGIDRNVPITVEPAAAAT